MKSQPKSNSTASVREAIRTAAREVRTLELEFKAAEILAEQAKLKLKAAKKNFKLTKKAARRLRKKLKKAHRKLDAVMTSARNRTDKSNAKARGSTPKKNKKTSAQGSRNRLSRGGINSHRSSGSSRAKEGSLTAMPHRDGASAQSSATASAGSGGLIAPTTE